MMIDDPPYCLKVYSTYVTIALIYSIVLNYYLHVCTYVGIIRLYICVCSTMYNCTCINMCVYACHVYLFMIVHTYLHFNLSYLNF